MTIPVSELKARTLTNSDTVVVLENELLYGTSFPMSDAAMKDDFLIPIGVAKIERVGKHVTLVAYSKAVQLALEAAEIVEKMGIQAEVRARSYTNAHTPCTGHQPANTATARF
jgi:pyruvate/2-oxoglutarate/acetoin dehydrogenase E1 component